MKITYDSKADALYIYLTSELHRVETRQMDEDVMLDFDLSDRLVGIEVLGASVRLELSYILSPQNEVVEYTEYATKRRKSDNYKIRGLE